MSMTHTFGTPIYRAFYSLLNETELQSDRSKKKVVIFLYFLFCKKKKKAPPRAVESNVIAFH